MGFGIWRHKGGNLSIPDHGEFDAPKRPTEHNMISMAKTFLDFYVEDGNLRDFEAAMVILNRAFHSLQSKVEAITPTLAKEIEAAATPPAAHEPRFSDKAEPGQLPVIQPLIKPLIPPLDELDE